MTFWYLASPYSKFPLGQRAAHRLACIEAGRLISAGIPVFSPIAHTHPIAMHAEMNPIDHTIWLPADRPMMEAARGLILLMAESWEESYGMEEERKAFLISGKPIVWMEPGTVPMALLGEAYR